MPQPRRRRRTFLARPFWRDYVLAYVLIALGFMLTSPLIPLPHALGLLIVLSGATIFTCAVGSSLHAAWRAAQQGERKTP